MLTRGIPENFRKSLPFLIIFAVTFLVFMNTLRFYLLPAWDDGEFVINMTRYFRPSIANLCYLLFDTSSGNYVPLVNFSYAIDYNFQAFTGIATYHFQSVFWHAATVCGLFQCMRFLGIPLRFALLTALLYAVSPQRTESVAWVAERRDVMCGAFYFWSLYFYFRGCGKKLFPMFPLILFVCALLSKPSAISMPCVLVMYKIWKDKSFFPFRKYLSLIPYFIFAALIAFGTARLQLYVGKGYDPVERTLIVLHNLAWYSVKNFYPGEMSPMYPLIVFGVKTLTYMAVFYLSTGALLVFIALRWKKFFIYTLMPLIVSYIAALFPTIGFVQIGTGTWDYADRYSYIPGGIAFFALAAGIRLLLRRKSSFVVSAGKLLPVFLACSVIFFAGTTFFYNYTWKTYRNLISVAAQHDPPNKYGLYFYGILTCDEMKLDESERAADLILASSRKDQLDNNDVSLYYMALYLKGRIAVKRGDHRQASFFFKDATRHLGEFLFQQNKAYIEALKTALNSFMAAGWNDEVLRCCDLIAANAPSGGVDFHFYRGLAFCMRGKSELAIQEFRKALELSPGDPNIKANIERLKEAAEAMDK